MRVLIVEDEVALATTLRHGLEAEGFTAEVAYDGQEGLWRATLFAYDVIVLDLMLPLLNGYEVCRQLRATGSHTPVLMLTAKDGEYDEADALDLGADDYMSKPFSFVVLVARLRALLRRGPVAKAPVLAAGSLRLDPASRRCWRGEAEVRLTPREFALAEYLVRREGEVVSKADIIDHVWDIAFDGALNVVEVYIGYLRRKLDQPFGLRTIETVRGAGYRLCDDTRPTARRR
jgi:DNA-binding response OmpR family regulator